MIKFTHRLFLMALLLLNLACTSTLYYIYDHIIRNEQGLTESSKVFLDSSFGMFIFMLWILFIVIVYYAKNGNTIDL